MTRARALAFGALVLASVAAFFVAQRLKSAPTVISRLTFESRGAGNVFSPNGDGRRDVVRIGFNVTDADAVTVTILNSDGDEIRTLAEDRQVGNGRRVWGLPWDGRDDHGRMVPDGRYRVRVTLSGQGRSFVPPTSIIKDTTPPQPRVASIGPDRHYGPEILPHADGAPATVRFTTPALACPQVRIYRTSPGRPRLVYRLSLPVGTQTFSWTGLIPRQAPTVGATVCRPEATARELAAGVPAAGADVAPAPAGTYVVVPEWRDAAGNVGRSIPLDARTQLPALGATRWPGRGGVTVRRMAVRAPVTPVTAGRKVSFDVDSRGRRYRWSMRMLGDQDVSKRSGAAKRADTIATTAPGRSSALYLLTAATRRTATTIPFPVQGRDSVAGEQGAPRGVLVMLPQVTWSGTNPADDDGDGQPNTLTLGQPSRLYRFQSGLPVGFRDTTAPIMVWLARQHRRYDLTTDAELIGASGGPQLDTYAGILIPGDMRWLPGAVRTRLLRYVRGGGTVVSLGTSSLRRTVALDRRFRLVKPSPDRVTDIFGARLRPVVHERTALTIDEDEKSIALFRGGAGRFPDVDAYEETIGLGDGKLLSSATTSRPAGRVVIVAERVGKGLVIRPGIAAFGRRLAGSGDVATTALMERMWELLSR